MVTIAGGIVLALAALFVLMLAFALLRSILNEMGTWALLIPVAAGVVGVYAVWGAEPFLIVATGMALTAAAAAVLLVVDRWRQRGVKE